MDVSIVQKAGYRVDLYNPSYLGAIKAIEWDSSYDLLRVGEYIPEESEFFCRGVLRWRSLKGSDEWPTVGRVVDTHFQLRRVKNGIRLVPAHEIKEE